MFRRPARHEGSARLVFDRGSPPTARARSTAACARARWSGSSGCAAPARKASAARSSGSAPVVTGGQVVLDGEAIAASSPREAIALGINLVCADRMTESVVPGLSIRENLFLNPRRRRRQSRRRICVPRAESDAAVQLGERIGLKPNDPSMPIDWLSGGNQQKVVVGRWLHLKGRIYVFEDPTAGVDVGAKAEIYRLFDAALTRRRHHSHRLDGLRRGRRRSATARWCSIAGRSSRSSPATISASRTCWRPRRRSVARIRLRGRSDAVPEI